MKKNLLVFIFSIFVLAAYSQAEKKSDFVSVSVFPNPATEFITVNNEEAVKTVQIFNFTGRKMKNFDIVKGERYDIADLPNGLYFVQLLGKNNKVLATQRLTKKS
jgi:hypothetical protein